MTQPSDLIVWLADLTYTQQTIAADVIPTAIGGIATYAESKLSLTTPIKIFKYPEALQDALNAGERPDVIGFSNYVWNGDLAYAFAQAIKKHYPDTIIVFGGPNYPTDGEEQAEYLAENPLIDFYIIKEGEVAFTNLLAAIIADEGDVDAVMGRELGSVHFRPSQGTAILTPVVDRLTDLTEIPSPYLSGRLDEFFDGKLLPILQTNRGCPFSCTFCVEGVGYYNKVRKNGVEKIDAELQYIGRKMQERRDDGGRNDLFIADSNFGMYADDVHTAHSLARTRQAYQWPEYINVATGKNQKERVLEVSRIVDGALRLSGSVQSLDPGVLENIKRTNIDAQDLFDLGLKAAEVGANTYSEIILALPGDSLKAHLSTVKTVMEAGFNNIYLFQLMLLPGTDMATDDCKRRFAMETRYRVLPRCYGHFEVLGDPVVAAEIEEICVSNATLSYEDYLEARRLHLLVTIFYNDGVFETLLKVIRQMGLSEFRWIEILLQSSIPPALAPLFESFETATREELWTDKSGLEAFVRQPGNVEKYIDGELGNNLLFSHKTQAITTYFEDLAEFARDTMQTLLSEADCDSEELFHFMDEALRFHCLRASHLFVGIEQTPSETFDYDIQAYLASDQDQGYETFKLPASRKYNFVLDATQIALIERNIGIYGTSPVSISRILSKVHVKKLFRHATLDGSGML
ncbi:MAG: hypothetical protein HOH61_22795 [Rhodospirillaceae bacterium]|nr:hypothetical protein [Rhodospirillaceae bacterium]MBT5193097.1 hypothetical protein [Rhodospirillaceae bacterium]MBT5898743.1 hypothetical protein [Rhodospirillaceae bacterium]